MSKCSYQGKTKLSKRAAERIISEKTCIADLRAYECQICGAWHLTSQPKKVETKSTYLHHYKEFQKYLCQ